MQPRTTIKELKAHIDKQGSFQKQIFDQTGAKSAEEWHVFCSSDANNAPDWVEGIKRLLKLTKDLDTSGGRTAAKFLCNIYNGHRVSFNLGELNNLSMPNWLDAINILKLNKINFSEIHNYIENGSDIFENLIERLRNEGYLE